MFYFFTFSPQYYISSDLGIKATRYSTPVRDRNATPNLVTPSQTEQDTHNGGTLAAKTPGTVTRDREKFGR